jgi:transmembrane sensor
MDSLPTYNNFPWELIISALEGGLSLDEALQFQQWQDLSEANREKFDQLQQIWKDGLADYILYKEADENKGWESLQGRMGNTLSKEPAATTEPAATEETADTRQEAIVIDGAFGKRVPMIKRLMAVAAVVLVAVGAGWWYLSGKTSSIMYETAADEQKKIALSDGSTIVLKPQTRIQLAGNYNKSSRTVILSGGEAYFEVSHQEQLPFIVDMDAASIKDIGTSFTVQKTKDSITVVVFSGKVAFTKKETGESRELSAGNSLCLYTGTHRFGEIRSSDAAGSRNSLQFDNSPLSEVITVLQKATGKRIRLNDSLIAQKKLTAQLDGESFDNDLKIICSSLNLYYTQKNGEYILKNKDTVAH